ncbi:MAG: RNA-binding transcriptional accessory protein [Candidatus Krumholzibacteriota bacterium]|nr:RNA-binding transcriptional accessory protein [Candidatus Krumholzibacteriota bacterium]
MEESYLLKIASILGVDVSRVRAASRLLDEGGTVPFIARYRKEATGSLDEVAITDIRELGARFKALDERKRSILESLEERGLLDDELRGRVLSADNLTLLEDIYLPYRPKRRTRATIAREKGLEPLAELLFRQDPRLSVDPVKEAAGFINSEIGVDSAEDALEGARDIIAEMISEEKDARAALRDLYMSRGMIFSSEVKSSGEGREKYRDYFDWSEPVKSAPSHRILAIFRAEKEKHIRLSIAPPEGEAVDLLLKRFVTSESEASRQVAMAVEDGFKRLLSVSIAAGIRKEMKERADREAIRVFSENLRELLLAPPLGSRIVLAVDPGFRTGCKIVCLGRQGQLLHHDTIFPHSGRAKEEESKKKIIGLCGRFNIEAVAIGNGTASRETEAFFRGIGLSSEIDVIVVNESGASIYSASKAGREEFPDHDITVRGSVSIGRRLMDPLAELVKIDPKSIGVGQYQHDVNQASLKKGLDDVVISCVNSVGVDVNTASSHLLAYVSGLGPVLAGNLVKHREKNGPFRSRRQLTDVPRFGERAFLQAGGFLRVTGGDNILDSSAVHPESYEIVYSMADDVGCSVEELVADGQKRAEIELERYTSEKTGMPTLIDIMDELARPGRDPREKFELFRFSDEVGKIEDVEKGMILPGIVTNVTAFGAFVDIGVHQDGLVHISQLSDRFVKDPSEIVRVGKKVRVIVTDVDLQRKRISLSMKNLGSGK